MVIRWGNGQRATVAGLNSHSRLNFFIFFLAPTWVTNSLNLRQSRRHGVGTNGCPRQGGRLQTVNHVPMESALASVERAYR